MTATEVLRRLLDERGVEHFDGTESTLWGYESYNEVTGIYRFSADESSDGYMQVRLWHATPEQAVAATLGRGTCELVNAAEDLGDGTSSCMCFECGYTALDDWWDEFKYCPNCGRKVVTNG